MAATSFEHRGPQCLLTLGRSTSPPLDQFPVRVCSYPLCYEPSVKTPPVNMTRSYFCPPSFDLRRRCYRREMLVGKRVVVSGLITRPELNAQVGEALSFGEASGRYTVQLGIEQIALRPANLTQAPFRARGVNPSLASSNVQLEPHSKVRMRGLSGRAELNGLGGTVLCWNEEKQRCGEFAPTKPLRNQRIAMRSVPPAAQVWGSGGRDARDGDAAPRQPGADQGAARGKVVTGLAIARGGRGHCCQGARAARGRGGAGDAEPVWRRRADQLVRRGAVLLPWAPASPHQPLAPRSRCGRRH